MEYGTSDNSGKPRPLDWRRSLDLVDGRLAVPSDRNYSHLASSWSSESDGMRKVTVVDESQSSHVTTYVNCPDGAEDSCRTALFEFLTNEVYPPRDETGMNRVRALLDTFRKEILHSASLSGRLASDLKQIGRVGNAQFLAWSASVTDRPDMVVTVAGYRSSIVDIELTWLRLDS